MAITPVATVAFPWAGATDGHSKVITPPAGLLDNDLLIVAFMTPSGSHIHETHIETANGTYTPSELSILQVTSPDFEPVHEPVVGNTFFGLNHLIPIISVHKRIYTTFDTDYTFNLEQYFPDSSVNQQQFNEYFGRFVLQVYRATAINTVFEQIRGEYIGLNNPPTWDIFTTKDDCMLVQFVVSNVVDQFITPEAAIDPSFVQRDQHDFAAVPAYQGGSIHPSFYGPFPTNYLDGESDVGDFLTSGQGSNSVTSTIFDSGSTNAFSSDWNAYVVVLAIIDISEDIGAITPTGGPSDAGVGYFITEKQIIEATDFEIWRYDPVASAIAIASRPPIRCLELILNYNGIGACVQSQAYFDQNPSAVPFTSILRLLLNDTTLVVPDYYYTGLIGQTEQSNGTWLATLRGLLHLKLLDQVGVGAETLFPVEAGIFPNFKNLFTGKTIPVVANSADEKQTWKSLLDKRYDPWPDATYGVAPNTEYVQGRPPDGLPVLIDYLTNRNIISLQVEPPVLNDYYTSWWADNGGSIVDGARTDLNPLTPRRVIESRIDGSSNLETPVGGTIPFFSDPTHIIKVAGIVLPPARVVNLPVVGAQYVATAEVNVIPSTEGSGSSITTTLRTVGTPTRRNFE